jgi:predicted nucleic acid-binding protein
VRQVFSIERADVEQAAEIAGLQRRLSARDALHLAVMQRHGVERILTLDEGFDLWPGIERAPLRER